MSEAILIWLYLSLGNIFSGGALIVICGALFIWLFFGSMIMSTELDKSAEEVMDVHKKYVPFKLILLIAFLTALYPSKDDLKYIIGGSLVINGVQAASDIEGVEKLPENLVNAMNVFLEKAVDDNTNR